MAVKSIQQIREELGKSGNHSHTSVAFQADLVQFIRGHSAEGHAVVEVGCYRGGLTAQFAAVCGALGKHLYVVDIDTRHIDIAKSNVDEIIGPNGTEFFLGDLYTFYRSRLLKEKPILVFIDADHRYSAVMRDLRVLLDSRPPPYAVALHDFSLRYQTPELLDVRVDHAIFDTFGKGIRLHPIGEIAGSGATLATEVQPDGHYHERGEPEGVLLFFEDMRLSDLLH